MRGRITVSLKYVQKSLTSSIGAMESIKSDVNVANVQCFYPLEAKIGTTGQCCNLLGSGLRISFDDISLCKCFLFLYFLFIRKFSKFIFGNLA